VIPLLGLWVVSFAAAVYIDFWMIRKRQRELAESTKPKKQPDKPEGSKTSVLAKSKARAKAALKR
jgi:hypothetical protein